MTDAQTETDEARRARLLQAALPNVAFEGWSANLLPRAAEATGIDMAEARRLFPRGAVDLAVAHHESGDAAMVAKLKAADLTAMRFRDRVAFALRARIEAIGDKEAARRASALFALPTHAPEGARLIWRTADLIWDTLGDPSEDLNWYTKRATLSAVWASVLLFWLGDDSWEAQATDAFIDRRIDDVMRIETMKARVNEAPLLKPFTGPLSRLTAMIRRPRPVSGPGGLPGRWTPGA
ncbi:COQ9 family protein [Wenxinia marina]|uniref:RpsU-divergently transcribed protein n=1 Tax=Wenxinia marina DSM 24838 TaxID=1123501 RepID=A0A0D0QHT9_9RHOB|nr:COQ9 family protein [Wenxinia marina]KIQ70623.1 rpsU-divergently transcribed protein [Wenxinia marina DSM 24838]GGL51695.1 hypothetical protein GCM10011392_02500 [Wenxinia marina]